MDVRTWNACLAEVRRVWRDSPHDLRPFTVWIAEHEPIAPDAEWPATPVVNAWLLNGGEVENRTAADYVRFVVVHSRAHWHTGSIPPPAVGVFNNRPGNTHTIGLAGFAPIVNSDLVYLHYIWGGTFGRGGVYRFDPETDALDWVRTLWLS